MTDLELVTSLSDVDVIAATIYGEARNQHVEGRIAIANVITNRAKAQMKAYGLTYRAVCLMPWQFSCWRKGGGEENHAQVIDACRFLSRGDHGGPMLRECVFIAEGVMKNAWTDSVKNATHYLTAELFALRAPVWTVGQQPVARVHDHLFFAGIT